MRIALIGYGKMGQLIASVARERGHEVVCIIDRFVERAKTASQEEQGLFGDYSSPAFRSADVAIEFSRPDAAEANVRSAIAQGVPVVSGTTGWDVPALRSELQGKEHPGVMWSSNYSIGVNVLFAVNTYLAHLLARSGGYSPSITEVHHIHKLDAPSGTAKTLAEQIAAEKSKFASPEGEGWICPVESVREGEVPGIHEVRWESEADILSLRHEAKTRKGFAVGAVLAAEWLCGKRGWHPFSEVLSLPER